MNKNSVLVLLSIVYLVFELGYRSVLVDELARPQFNPAVYEVIEGLGRLITSFGLTILCVSIIQKIAEQWWLRAALLMILFMTINVSLKTLIQSTIEALPVKQKELAFYGYKLRNFVYNTSGDIVSKQHLLTLPLSAWSLQLHKLDKKTLAKLVKNSRIGDSPEYRAFLRGIVDDNWNLFRPIWQEYRAQQTQLNKHLTEKEAAKKIKFIRQFIRKEGRDLFAEYRSQVMRRLYKRTESNSRDYTMRFYLADKIVTPTYDASGRAKETDTRKNRAYYLLKRGTHRYGSVADTHYYRPHQDASRKRYASLQKINAEYGFSRDIYTYTSFAKTAYFVGAMNKLLHKKVGIDFPLKKFDDAAVRNLYRATLQHDLNSELVSMLTANELECELDLFKQPFTHGTYIKFIGEFCFARHLKNTAGYLFDDKGRILNILSKDQQFSAMKNLNAQFQSEKFDQFRQLLRGNLPESALNYYAKGVFIPVVVVFFANLAIFANVVRIVLLCMPTTKFNQAITLLLFCGALATPFFLELEDIEGRNQKEQSLLTQTRHPIANWFEGVESLLATFSPITETVKPWMFKLQLVYIDAALPSDDDIIQQQYWRYHKSALLIRVGGT